MIENAVRTRLLSYGTTVTNLVGSGDNARIRPDELSQSDTMPAIIVTVESETPLEDLTQGSENAIIASVLVMCISDTKSQSRLLEKAVRLNDMPKASYAGLDGDAWDSDSESIKYCTWKGCESEFVPLGEDGDDSGRYVTTATYEIWYEEL